MKLRAALFVVITVSALYSQNDPNTIWNIGQVSTAFRTIVKQVKPAVVYIEVSKEQGSIYSTNSRSSGSGVVVDAKNGYVLTAYHVIENVSRVKVKLADGQEVQATDIRGDVQTDLAVIKIDANNLAQAMLGDSDQIEVGDWVLAIGSPFGAALENSVSAGIVSAKGRRTNVLGKMGIENYIQTDAVINKGNSGGPLVNIKGEVIGISSNIISSTGMYAGLGFAVPSNMVKPVFERLVKEGKVVRGWLGIVIASMSEVKGKVSAVQISHGGVYIVDVVNDGPGEKGGLKIGDIITAVDGKKVNDSFELINTVSWKRPGQMANCDIWRDNQSVTLPVLLGERPVTGDKNPRSVEITDQDGSLDKLGISVADLEVEVNTRGIKSRVKAAVVLKIEKNSPANQMKIEVGDIITKINQNSIESAKDFEQMLSKLELSRDISLTILRSTGEDTVIIKPLK